MQITRTETPTGGPNRTRREEIVSLIGGEREVEPEYYGDFSGSEGWEWERKPGVCTWDVQLAAMRAVLIPFEALDSQAKGEQASGDDDHGGVYAYMFNNHFLPLGHGDDDGDLNSANFDEKVKAFLAKYGDNGRPQGGTTIMAAVAAGDKHFLGEFGKDGENETARDERPVRARIVWTDGALSDADAFKRYLENATRNADGFGAHGEWDEVWAIVIIGEGQQADGTNPGKDAYQQYKNLAAHHGWIHVYYFEDVVNSDEIAEDVAIAVVPGSQS